MFADASVLKADDDALELILKSEATSLDTGQLVNRGIKRILIVNAVKNQRHIDEIESRNTEYTKRIIKMTRWTIGLATVSIICSVVQIGVAIFQC